MSVGLAVDPQVLAAVCRRHRVAKLEVFGSRAHGIPRADSDVDLLVSFADGYMPSLFAADGFMALVSELEQLFGHPVDLLTRASVEQDPNEYFRASALAGTEVLYAA